MVGVLEMKVDLVSGYTTTLDKVARLAFSFGHVAKDIAYLERLSDGSPDYKDYVTYTKPAFALMVRLCRDLSDQLGYDWDDIMKLGDERMEELDRSERLHR